MNTNSRQLNRQHRHHRIRAKISGTAERPRITVFKSNQHTYVQAIDDVTGKTLVGLNDAKVKGKTTKTDRATAIGKDVAAALKKLGVKSAVFDISGFKYHGRVKAVAEGMRQGGIIM